MQDLFITPETIDDIGHEARTIVVEDLNAFDRDALNDLRFRLSELPIAGPTRIEGEAMSADAAVDLLVARLVGKGPGRRISPDRMTQAEWTAVGQTNPGFGVHCFYVDRERQPFDSGLMYDVFESAMYAEEEMFGDMPDFD